MKIVYLLLALLAVALAALAGLRLWDWRAEQREWARLAGMQPDQPPAYDPAMVAELPRPAQRFFNFAITPGTPLLTVAEIEMGGELGFGSRDAPNYRPMAARQILAAPHGFEWRARLPGAVPVSGSDSGRWTRFRVLGLIPVARAGGDPDHARSAFGRYVAEAVFWTPAALLPGPGVAWEDVDASTARVAIRRGALSQAVDVTVEDDGRPVEVSSSAGATPIPTSSSGSSPSAGRCRTFARWGATASRSGSRPATCSAPTSISPSSRPK